MSDKIIRVGDFPIGEEERRAVSDVFDAGKISEGEFTKRFEVEFAKKNGNRYCVAVSSGTSALIAGLMSLIYSGKIKKGSKVITTPLTYISTVNAIVLAGLEPVFVDIEESGLNISAAKIEKLLEKGSAEEYSLILPVHLMGYPCDMKRINEIAEKYGLLVFEDAAQAHGTKIGDKKTGNFSIM
ncbi:MAG TPA: aminotransferase class I/II-fold pyridoxal phosphate-dependent enzyme, partial [Firmicutes bacterium]|nr:aminotransferase class I/II-fold pyridoxal phosphate-dependent enzyme [Bacillota bacterium]